MLPDIGSITNVDCMFGQVASVAVPVLFVVVLVGVSCVAQRSERYGIGNVQASNAKRREAAAAAISRSAHFSNFGWALFTLGSPIMVARLVQLMRGLGVVCASVFWLFIPRFAVMQLRKAKAAGVLRSSAIQSRYGWMCSRCVHSLF